MRKAQPFFIMLLFAFVAGASVTVHAEGSAARALFAQLIVDREPVDQIVELTNDNSKVYFFTELRGLKGQSVTHRWEYDGKPQAAVTFNVGANRWRVWSSKNLQPGWTGLWTVSVLDEAGNVITEETLNYVSAEDRVETEMVEEMPAQ
ncbi:MAG: DUF2914 domain-containing protein [Chromatiales bacterium]|nr:DUF2914 domain-containing protein [Chromatiales bacterium]